ncbi:MAG: GNAT family N-acetyltransferase [Xanthomonadaceae bacterium]|jgi:GNAT superfamily N-acetyltransferase|nr:GNAT family N-acetyltransferase [Xanthomonadaceae bacterium]
MSQLRISTSKQELDLLLIHRFLSTEAYWSRGIPLGIVQRAIAGSLCFGGYLEDRQVAFARVVTDYATFAYLADVFVLADHRGQGYAKQLLHAVMEHPRLQDLRCFMLSTADAQGLYSRLGFTALAKPENLMEIRRPDPYRDMA